MKIQKMKIFDNFKNKFSKFIILDRETSTITLSQALYNSIKKTTEPIHEDNGKKKWDVYKACFWKMRDANDVLSYVFYVNPDWNKHGVTNSNFVYQTPLLVDPNEHISMKSVMPTVNEILSVYGIPGERVEMKVSVQYLNNEPYYLLDRKHYKVLSVGKSTE